MKGLIKIFAAIMIFLSVCMMPGCAGGNKDENSDLILVDFERYAPDFSLIRLGSEFGSVNVNKNPEFVHGGEASAELRPMGSSLGSRPYMSIPLSSTLYEYDYSDISCIEYVRMYLYSGEESAVTVGFTAANGSLTSGHEFELSDGWNEIIYYPDHTVINLSFELDSMAGVYLQFDNAGVDKVADAKAYYLDDVSLMLTDPVTVEDIIELDEGEVMDFEKAYQKYVISGESTKPKCMPEVSVVRASEYGLTAPSGEHILKVVTKPGDSREATWPRVVIPEKIIRRAFSAVSEADYANYRFAFDTYAFTGTRIWYAEFYGSGGTSRIPEYTIVEKGKWSTYSRPLSTLKDVHLNNPGFFKIAVGEYVDAGEQIFFFDNFRLEKIA